MNTNLFFLPDSRNLSLKGLTIEGLVSTFHDPFFQIDFHKMWPLVSFLFFSYREFLTSRDSYFDFTSPLFNQSFVYYPHHEFVFLLFFSLHHYLAPTSPRSPSPRASYFQHSLTLMTPLIDPSCTTLTRTCLRPTLLSPSLSGSYMSAMSFSSSLFSSSVFFSDSLVTVSAVRAGQAPVQVPLLPGRHVDADQRARQRHAADGPLPLSQGGGRLPHQAAGLPEPRRPDRLPV